MPSPYSSKGSIEDARQLAKNLKIRFEVKNIEESYRAIKELFLSGGKQKFDNSVADENIQPRLRACILMAFANENDPCLLLTTGNKSELSVGYCTLYGDMCGGLAVISDLWKTQVYELARYINKRQEENLIPISTIEKPPSAELAPDQMDTDSLPPYEVLDPILREIVEQDLVVCPGTDLKRMDLFNKIYRLYRRSEFKRQQMPPGPKISKRSFGMGRRMPIAANIRWI